MGGRPAHPHRLRRRARWPGTLNFGLDGAFATYLGWLIPWGTPLTLLGETAEQVAEAQRELVRIGIDRPGRPPPPAARSDWADAAAARRYRGRDFADLAQVAPPPAGRRPGRPPQPGVGRVAHRRRRRTSRCTSCRAASGEVPDGEVWVHCAAGYRASIAASLLAAAGRTVVAGRRRVRSRRPRGPAGGRPAAAAGGELTAWMPGTAERMRRAPGARSGAPAEHEVPVEGGQAVTLEQAHVVAGLHRVDQRDNRRGASGGNRTRRAACGCARRPAGRTCTRCSGRAAQAGVAALQVGGPTR